MSEDRKIPKLSLEEQSRLFGYSVDQILQVENFLATRPKTPAEFRAEHQVRLAWSNKNASDELLIRKSLLSGYFTIILDAVRSFGFSQVNDIWNVMLSEDEVIHPKILRMTTSVMRDLQNANDKAASINKKMLEDRSRE